MTIPKQMENSMDKDPTYSELKQHIIDSLNESITMCKDAKFKSCIEGLNEALNYVNNDCPDYHNHYGCMYHRLPYDILKSPFGKYLNRTKSDLADVLVLSVFDSGDLIDLYVNEQRKNPDHKSNLSEIDSETQRRLDMFDKRFDKELTTLKRSFISNRKVRAMATVWMFLNVYENYYKPCMKHFDKMFSDVCFNNYDSWSEASLLMRFNSVHLKSGEREIIKLESAEERPDRLISDFYFIRNAIAHSTVDFPDNQTIRFISRNNPEVVLDLPIKYFIEYPQLMSIKVGVVSFLYECKRQSVLIDALRNMSK